MYFLSLTGSVPAESSPFSMMFPFIAIMAIFYLLVFRPQQKQQKEHQAMIKSVGKNDEIITSGGIHGTVVNVKDDTVTLRIDDAVKIELQKSHITTVKKKRAEKDSKENT